MREIGHSLKKIRIILSPSYSVIQSPATLAQAPLAEAKQVLSTFYSIHWANLPNPT